MASTAAVSQVKACHMLRQGSNVYIVVYIESLAGR